MAAYPIPGSLQGGFLVLVIAAFLVKCLVVLAVASKLRHRVPDTTGRLLAGWLIVQSGMIAGMLVLSLDAHLGQPAALLAGASALIGAALVLRRQAAWPTLARESKWSLPFVFILVVMLIRSRLFPDFTWDAQTYGLVRFAFWIQEGSILGHQLAPQINTFTNEWDGELVALFYGLVAHNLQGVLMGGVETLALLYLATLYLACQVSGSIKWQQVTATIATVTPASLGLATVVKGDLLAVVSIVMASGWGINAIRAKRRISLIFCGASMALAVGSKISVLLSVILIAAIVLVFCYQMIDWRVLTAVVFAALAFDLRYILNFIQYGRFVVRAGGERPEFSFANLANNADLIWQSISTFGYQAPGQRFGSWSLQGGLCLTGIIGVGALAAALFMRLRLPSIGYAAVAGSVAAASLYPEYPWNFRYFLPGLLVLVVCAISRMRYRGSTGTFLIAVVVPLVNSAYLFVPGEMNGGTTFFKAFSYLISTPDSIRRTFMPDRTREDHTDFDMFSAKRLGRVSIFQDIDTMILPFFGSKLDNQIELASSEEEFRKSLSDPKVEAAVRTFNRVTSDPERVGSLMSQAGFDIVKRDEQYVIGMRRRLLNSLRDDSVLAPRFASGIQWLWGPYDIEGAGTSAFMWMRAKAELAVKIDGVSCVHLNLESPLVSDQRVSATRDGHEIESHEIRAANEPKMVWDLTVQSNSAWTVVDLTAERPAAHAPPDPRSLAYLVHLPVVVDVGSACPP